MVAPQVAACMRSEKTAEPAFYQNQTTVCRSRVPSHHISGSFLCCGFLSTVLSLASSFTQECIASAVAIPDIVTWMSGFILAFKVCRHPHRQNENLINECNFFFLLLVGVLFFFCHAFLFSFSFFVDVCHPPKPLPGTGKFSLTLWILVYLRHVENI